VLPYRDLASQPCWFLLSRLTGERRYWTWVAAPMPICADAWRFGAQRTIGVVAGSFPVDGDYAASNTELGDEFTI